MKDNTNPVSPPRFLDELRRLFLQEHLPPKVVARRVELVKRFILFHDKKHPAELGDSNVAAFLESLDKDAPNFRQEAQDALQFVYAHLDQLPGPPPPPPRLLDRFRSFLRQRQVTEATAAAWANVVWPVNNLRLPSAWEPCRSQFTARAASGIPSITWRV